MALAGGLEPCGGRASGRRPRRPSSIGTCGRSGCGPSQGWTCRNPAPPSAPLELRDLRLAREHQLRPGLPADDHPVRGLARPEGRLVRRPLADRMHLPVGALALDELVYEAGGGVPAAGHQAGADPVAVQRLILQLLDPVLVEVAGGGDARGGRAERVQQLPHASGLLGPGRPRSTHTAPSPGPAISTAVRTADSTS